MKAPYPGCQEACLTKEESLNWDKVKVQIMREILDAKAKSCDLFRQALIDSDDKPIYEGTSDAFWGVGLDERLASTTRTVYLNKMGKNVLGKLLCELRDCIRNENRLQDELCTPFLNTPAAPAAGIANAADSNLLSPSTPRGNSQDNSKTLLSLSTLPLLSAVISPVKVSPSTPNKKNNSKQKLQARFTTDENTET